MKLSFIHLCTTRPTFEFAEKIVRLVAFDNVASTLLLVLTGLKQLLLQPKKWQLNINLFSSVEYRSLFIPYEIIDGWNSTESPCDSMGNTHGITIKTLCFMVISCSTSHEIPRSLHARWIPCGIKHHHYSAVPSKFHCINQFYARKNTAVDCLQIPTTTPSVLWALAHEVTTRFRMVPEITYVQQADDRCHHLLITFRCRELFCDPCPPACFRFGSTKCHTSAEHSVNFTLYSWLVKCSKQEP